MITDEEFKITLYNYIKDTFDIPIFIYTNSFKQDEFFIHVELLDGKFLGINPIVVNKAETLEEGCSDKTLNYVKDEINTLKLLGKI